MAMFCLVCCDQVGGRNTVLVDALMRRMPLVSDIPTIIFGADVTHPHPGEDLSPSIAAVSHYLPTHHQKPIPKSVQFLLVISLHWILSVYGFRV